MNTRERFGNYILLKKLSEDSLGEVFRAGRFGGQGIEQVALLRVFNGQGLDSARLWQRVSQRGEIQAGLRSPNLGSGIDFGELQGVPFVVYDYISGKDLGSLQRQARRERSAIPADHALLITERVALGLAAAYENRFQGSRILHGFVVPPLVMISNEGEARLLGFEAAAGLHDMAATSPALKSFERYLSPEVLAGQPAHKADDVYSLGVLLFELLTGHELSEGGPATSLDALVDGATLASEGVALPSAIATLIKRSLAPRDQRIADTVTWHKALSQLMIDGQYNPTTFNLAFFMHNLFRDEIERESREIVAEKNIGEAGLQIPATTASGAGAGASAGAETIMISSKDVAAAVQPPEAAAAAAGKSKSRVGAIAAVLVAALALGGFAAWYFLARGGADSVASTPAGEPVPAPEPVPAGPTQEEIQAEMEGMRAEMADAMAAQSEEMRQALAGQYEGKIKELQKEYEQSQAAIAERRRKEQEAALAAQQAAIEDEARKRTQLATDEQARKQAAARPSPAAPATTPPAVAESAPPITPSGASPRQTAPTRPAPQAAPPPEPEPAVKVGQLVKPGPGVVAPKLSQQVVPPYPSAARRIRREATVIVRVLVDENGKVVQTERLGKKVGLGIDEAAEDAAAATTFRPATKDGVRVKMWHSLRFDFRP